MQVLFPALSLFITGNKVFQLHINQFELALSNTEQNFLIYLNPLEKNSSYVSGVSVCIFVAFSVRMCAAGANKVEGTISWWLGSNEILALSF